MMSLVCLHLGYFIFIFIFCPFIVTEMDCVGQMRCR